MKTKTEARRQAILAKAAEVFREQGVAKASMSRIGARARGSKATPRLVARLESERIDRFLFKLDDHSEEAEIKAVTGWARVQRPRAGGHHCRKHPRYASAGARVPCARPRQ